MTPPQFRAVGSGVLTAAVVYGIGYFLSPLMVAWQLRVHGFASLQTPPPSLPLGIIIGLLLFGGLGAAVRRSRLGVFLAATITVATLGIYLAAAMTIPPGLGGIASYCGEIVLAEQLSSQTSAALGVQPTGDPQAPYRTAPQEIVDVGDRWLYLRPAGVPTLINWRTVRAIDNVRDRCR